MKRNCVRRTRYRLEQGLTFVAMRLVRLGSLGSALRAADALGWIIYRLLGMRKRVVLANLRLAFPGKSRREIDRIALRTYQNVAKMIFEFIRLPVMGQREVRDRYLFVRSGPWERALKSGRGIVVVAGHFGNWEIMAVAAALEGHPVHVLVKKQRNRKVGALIDALRTRMGVRIIYLGAAVREALRALRHNETVALLGDQRAGRDGVWVDFFGVPASTHQGPAVFALRTGAPLLFASAVRQPDGRHRISFQEVKTDDLQGATPENIRILTRRHTALLEQAIREHPDHWFWMHKRWKKKPSVGEKDRSAGGGG
ncbi:lysophospholipid acyltransferase family protein [bacterium]|nr:lysophospholipid acyltransferase family protein [bacterium]